MSHGANPKSRIVAGVAAAVFLTGCGFKITAPSSGAYVTNPVSAEIKWAPDYHANTLKIVVDPSSSNLDVTSQFQRNSLGSGPIRSQSCGLEGVIPKSKVRLMDPVRKPIQSRIVCRESVQTRR